ncbi:unnamed protein product [Chilo suppressalis]|uniref:FZ domain-containing protein n=1 Tax=Chilo suppressalis TaxID=168631 RepID=A0ABN8BAS6_CHISP|nr:unnamed protein product [Chilo suppressalis]
MPDNINTGMDSANGTYWDPVAASAGAQTYKGVGRSEEKPKLKNFTQPQSTKTTEIDFYDADTERTHETQSNVISATQSSATNKLPAQPVFPDHLTPEVQYGNEKADSDKLRNAKMIEESNDVPDDSTLKPHITQKPEKPLQIFFKDGNGVTTTTSTETIVKAETLNDLTNYGEKFTTKRTGSPAFKPQPPAYRQYYVFSDISRKTTPQVYQHDPEVPSKNQEFYPPRRPANVDISFTSGHSKLFGISIEDAEKMKSTTQTSTYNTRVSPTLPTWRDGDDSTTKKYPVNINYDVPQCGSTRLAFCRGVLPYDLAGPSAIVNGVELLQLLPQVEYLVATNCSERVRQFMCALLEPECNPPPYPPKMPCYNLCKTITDSCEGLIPRELSAAFNCNQYSSSNCVAAKSPCYQREFQCGDGSCVPRDWICDGAQDCANGEDEAKCVICEPNEYRCESGGCIQSRWMCDGYSDCPNGEDELPTVCEAHGGARAESHPAEPGEESAGSAPAPAVRKPNQPQPSRSGRFRNQKIGDNDSSKELLVTSDSSNALRRNFTRRPSLSRLTPYTRPALKEPKVKPQEPPKEENEENSTVILHVERKKPTNLTPKPESVEDVNIGDLGFFEDAEKEVANTEKPDSSPQQPNTFAGVPTVPDPDLTHLDSTINKLEKVIDGASLLRKAVAQQEIQDSPESNNTTVEKEEFSAPVFSPGSVSAHASPCPSGELRCVDGRCITLAQLCDGTIDCTDHADEDNCYA